MFTPTILYEASKGHQHELEQQAATRRLVEEAGDNAATPPRHRLAALNQQAQAAIAKAQTWWNQRPQLEWKRMR